MLDSTKLEVLTFDCYGTLIDWEEGILRCLHALLGVHGKDVDDATILKLYGDFEAAAEQGEFRSYREVLKSVVIHFGEAFDFAATRQQAESLPESLKDWKPWPDTVDALKRLKKQFGLASFQMWTTIFSR